ncbi:MAG: 30S ribosomal protein S20, partial [bacterium]|nr:30S ribosomal protein S20 [bacterium]
MPITNSAKKALRQSQRRRKHNLVYKNKIKELEKSIKRFLASKDAAKAGEILSQLYKTLDKAAKENVIKKNTASRKKSRICRMVSKMAK